MVRRIASLIAKIFKLARAGGVSFENGVYIWKEGLYVKQNIDREGELFGKADYYLIYFHNNLCPSCRKFYPLFENALKSAGGEFARITHIKVVCDWFTTKCTDPVARKLFTLFNVTATPKLLLVKIDLDGSVHVVRDIIEDLGTSIFSQEHILRALINLTGKNVGGIDREEHR